MISEKINESFSKFCLNVLLFFKINMVDVAKVIITINVERYPFENDDTLSEKQLIFTKLNSI